MGRGTEMREREDRIDKAGREGGEEMTMGGKKERERRKEDKRGEEKMSCGQQQGQQRKADRRRDTREKSLFLVCLF